MPLNLKQVKVPYEDYQVIREHAKVVEQSRELAFYPHAVASDYYLWLKLCAGKEELESNFFSSLGIPPGADVNISRPSLQEYVFSWWEDSEAVTEEPRSPEELRAEGIDLVVKVIEAARESMLEEPFFSRMRYSLNIQMCDRFLKAIKPLKEEVKSGRLKKF